MLILYVDDDPEDQEVFRDALYSVDSSIKFKAVQDGLQALTFLSKAEELPAYIFTDVNMPRMSGKMFLQNLKTNAAFTNIPVIITSTHIHRDDEKEYLKLGAEKIFTKARSFSELIEDIRSVVTRS